MGLSRKLHNIARDELAKFISGLRSDGHIKQENEESVKQAFEAERIRDGKLSLERVGRVFAQLKNEEAVHSGKKQIFLDAFKKYFGE